MQYIELMQVSIFSNCGIEEECSHLPEQPLYHGPHTQIQCGTCGQINITRFHLGTNFTGSNKLGAKFQYRCLLLFLY
jgi:hypothetical protein